MVYTFFDNKTSGGSATLANKSAIKNENISNKELAKELHKPIIRKFDKRKVLSAFIHHIWGADLADMQLISIFNKEFWFLLCVIEIYSKYAWVIPLKDKKGDTITNAFQKNFKFWNFKSQIKQNMGRKRRWISEFHNRTMKSGQEKNAIEIYATHHEGKSVVAERFIRILKSNIFKYMASVLKNVYIDKLDDLVNK